MDKQAVIRRVRIAVSAFFAMVTVALVVLWVRSYWYVEQVLCTVDEHFIFIGSLPGVFGFSILAEESVDPWIIYRLPTREWLASGEGLWLEQSWGGFHISYIHGPVVMAPYWCWLLIPAMLTAMPWLHRLKRFSLRTIHIATTLAAVVLGLGASAVVGRIFGHTERTHDQK